MLGTIKKIKFNTMASSDFPTFNMILDCSFNDDNGEVPSYLNREGVMTENHNGTYQSVYQYKYNERFSPKITFLKEGFTDFEDKEVRAVLKWLTSKSTPSYAYFYEDIYSEIAKFCALGGWTNIQLHKISNSRVVGITAVFEATTPYAFSDIHTYKRTITGPTTFTVTCDNDDTAYVYPRVTIKQKSGTEVIITNTITTPETDLFTGVTVNKTRVFTTAVRNNQVDETVIIDGANKLIYSETYPNRTFGTDFGTHDIHNQWVWLPLVDGENIITVTGNCELTLEYREVRKIGEY